MHKSLNKTEFLQQVWLCQGNLDWRQGKVREMSGNLVLSSLYEPCSAADDFLDAFFSWRFKG